MLDFGENKSVLVIVPHEDDEINLMGGLLPLLVEKNMDVNICFVTNGDFEVPGELRIEEALSAMQCIGISKEKVFFLGYPDASHLVDHSIYKTEKIVTSKYGCYTYGSLQRSEFRMQESGVHSPYLYSALKEDLKDLLLKIKPNIIFCNDMDPHEDHKLCSMVFEECVREISSDTSVYRPIIFKGFAYSTSYDSVNDFFSKNNVAATQKPLKNGGELDNPLFLWESRVRFPVSPSTLVMDYKSNVLIKAICKHRSQFFAKRIGSVINSDVVFWEWHYSKNDHYNKHIEVYKIVLNGDFAYNEYFVTGDQRLKISIYGYGDNSGIELRVLEDGSSLNEEYVDLLQKQRIFTIILIDRNGTVLDKVKVIRKTVFEEFCCWLNRKLTQLKCYVEYKKEKKYRKKLLRGEKV